MKVLLTTDTHVGMNHKTDSLLRKFLKEVQQVIKDTDVKVVLHTGDWASDKQSQLHYSFRLFREYIDIPIVGVKGNHDYWTKTTGVHLGQRERITREIAVLNNIILLEGDSVMIEDIKIAGFTGWYHYVNAMTNDQMNMRLHDVEGCNPMLFLQNRAARMFAKVIFDTDYSNCRKCIGITHFPPFTDNDHYKEFCANEKYLDYLTDTFDVLCVGHSHQRWDTELGNCRIYNAGSDYNQPKYILFDI